MRVVAGKFRGRPLQAPEGRDTRPTIDRVREAMFSSIASSLDLGFEDISVLDAFAGSGALGIEALSRGAEHCTFFDTSYQARKVIEDNLHTCMSAKELASCAKIQGTNVFQSSPAAFAHKPYALLLFDPPYKTEAALLFSFIERIDEADCICDNALIVYEHDAKMRFEESTLPQGFFIEKEKTYGTCAVSYIRKDASEIRANKKE